MTRTVSLKAVEPTIDSLEPDLELVMLCKSLPVLHGPCPVWIDTNVPNSPFEYILGCFVTHDEALGCFKIP